MTWTKFGADYPDRMLRMHGLSPTAFALATCGTIWSNNLGTDGAIPTTALYSLAYGASAEADAAELIKVGLWKATRTGWIIVGFLDDQPSAADVERTSALGRERQRRQRQHRNGDHSLCDPSYCRVSRVTSRVTDDEKGSQASKHADSEHHPPNAESRVSHNTRTDPTRTGPKGQGDGVGEGTDAQPERPGADAPTTRSRAVPDKKKATPIKFNENGVAILYDVPTPYPIPIPTRRDLGLGDPA